MSSLAPRSRDSRAAVSASSSRPRRGAPARAVPRTSTRCEQPFSLVCWRPRSSCRSASATSDAISAVSPRANAIPLAKPSSPADRRSAPPGRTRLGPLEAARRPSRRARNIVTPGRAGSSQPSCSHHSSASAAGVGPNAIASPDSTRKVRSRLLAPARRAWSSACIVAARQAANRQRRNSAWATPCQAYMRPCSSRGLSNCRIASSRSLELLSGAFAPTHIAVRVSRICASSSSPRLPAATASARTSSASVATRSRSLSGSAAASSSRSHADGMPGGESATARSRSAQRARTSPRSPARSAACQTPTARAARCSARASAGPTRRGSGAPARGGSRDLVELDETLAASLHQSAKRSCSSARVDLGSAS